MTDCLFSRYDLDGLDGDQKTYTYGQLLNKCKCPNCQKEKEILKKIKEEKKK